MERYDILFSLLILFTIFICLKIYHESDTFSLKCVISDVNGDKYCVRERSKVQEASDKLARTVTKCKTLIAYLKKNYPDNSITINLTNNFNPKKILETLPTSQHTAYSENKGEKLAFCLNKQKDNNEKLIDDNTLMFVALHELSHLSTTDIGHTQKFWDNFKFILEGAVKCGIYIPVDYKKHPTGYCGMTITDNPYYDL